MSKFFLIFSIFISSSAFATVRPITSMSPKTIKLMVGGSEVILEMQKLPFRQYESTHKSTTKKYNTCDKDFKQHPVFVPWNEVGNVVTPNLSAFGKTWVLDTGMRMGSESEEGIFSYFFNDFTYDNSTYCRDYLVPEASVTNYAWPHTVRVSFSFYDSNPVSGGLDLLSVEWNKEGQVKVHKFNWYQLDLIGEGEVTTWW